MKPSILLTLLAVGGVLFVGLMGYGIGYTDGQEDGYLNGYCNSQGANETLCGGTK